MFDESQRGHLKFWFSEFDEVAVAVAVEVVMLVVQEGEDDDVGGVSRSALPPPPLLMEIFLSPGMWLALAPPNIS